MAATATDCKCRGTGARRFTDGYGSGSVLCSCRKSEPPREGKVDWWTSETVKTMEFESATKFDTVTATIDRERPVSEDNHRLIRTPENVYFPAMARLDAGFGDVGFTSDMLREFAKWLNEVADEVDRIDAEIS
jgi:hypothetical protein